MKTVIKKKSPPKKRAKSTRKIKVYVSRNSMTNKHLMHYRSECDCIEILQLVWAFWFFARVFFTSFIDVVSVPTRSHSSTSSTLHAHMKWGMLVLSESNKSQIVNQPWLLIGWKFRPRCNNHGKNRNRRVWITFIHQASAPSIEAIMWETENAIAMQCYMRNLLCHYAHERYDWYASNCANMPQVSAVRS